MCEIQIIYLLNVLSLEVSKFSENILLSSAQQDEHLWCSCQAYMKVSVKIAFLFQVNYFFHWC